MTGHGFGFCWQNLRKSSARSAHSAATEPSVSSSGVSRFIASRSPADGGLPPYELDDLLGRKLARPLVFEQAVAQDDVEPVEQPVAAREA